MHFSLRVAASLYAIISVTEALGSAGEEDDEEPDNFTPYRSPYDDKTLVYGHQVGSIIVDDKFLDIPGAPGVRQIEWVPLSNGRNHIVQVEATLLDGKEAEIELVKGGPGHLTAVVRLISQEGEGLYYAVRAYTDLHDIPPDKCFTQLRCIDAENE